MSRVEKILEKWLNDPPVEVPKEGVLAMIKRFFPGQYEQGSGSHIVIRDDRLIDIPNYGPAGDFDVVIKGGQKVKGFYLRKLAQTIKLLEDIEK